MSKTGDIAKVSAKGSFHLLWGLVVSSLISSVGIILIARLLGSDSYGLYTVALTVPTIFSIFRDVGINYAMVKFSAQYRSEGRLDEIRNVFLSGVIFEVVVGLLLTFLAFSLADFLAISVFNRPLVASLIKVVSLSILASGLVTAATAVFTGCERLELNSIMLIFQSIFKTAIIIGLVLLGLGTFGASVGFTVGTVVAGVIGLVLIRLIYLRLPKSSHKLEIKAYLTAMLSYCLPLSFASIITLLLPQFYAFLLPIHYPTDNVTIGNYAVAINFVALISFFSTPVTTMVFPAFSKLDAKKEIDSMRNIFKYSVKYASLLVVPVAVLVMSTAEPAVETLFGTTYLMAPLFLALLAIQYLYTAFGNLSLTGFLNGQGQTSYFLKISIVTGVIGFPLGYVSIMIFGVLGLILAVLVSSIPGLFMGLNFIRKTYSITIDWGSSVRILFSSCVAGVVTFFVVSELAFAAWLRLLLGAALFLVVLVPALLLSRAVSRFDIANLKLMVGGLGAFGRLLSRLLTFLEHIMGFLRL